MGNDRPATPRPILAGILFVGGVLPGGGHIVFIDREQIGGIVNEIQSPEIDKLSAALAKAQGAISSAQKDGSNPHFKSTYATLDSIWQACRKPLSENGLAVVQLPMSDEAGLYLITTLSHSSGQWVRSYLRSKLMADNAQGIGSALTYLRRYALAAIVGVAPADEDDDGEGAADRPAQTQQPARPAPPAPPAPPAESHAPAKPNGNGKANGNDDIPTNPKDLFDLVNKRVQVPYDKVPHLYQAIKGDEPGFTGWPTSNDVAGWQKCYEVAMAHAKAKEQPAQTDAAAQDELPF